MMAVALSLLLASAAPTTSDAELVSSLVAAAASKDARLDVLSAADVRNAIDLEAQRAVMGCDATSCLLEVAGAMNARLVVHGTMGSLGDIVVLTLSAFDTANASSLGRVVLQEAKVDSLGTKIPDAVKELLERAPTPSAGTRVRTVVLDVKLATPTSSSPPAGPALEPAPAAPFPWAGVGLVGAGVVVLAVGAGADLWAALDAGALKEATPQPEALAVQERRNILAPVAVAGYIVGGVVAAAGAVVLVMGGLE